MSFSQMHDMGRYLLPVIAQLPYTATAGSSPDNVEKNGQTIDRLTATRRNYQSAILIMSYTATLDTLETVSFTANGQMDSASNFSTAQEDMVARRAYQIVEDGPVVELTLTSGALAAQVVGTGGTETGLIVMEFDLVTAKRYIRSQMTTNLSRANTDTSLAGAIWIFGGADALPAT